MRSPAYRSWLPVLGVFALLGSCRGPSLKQFTCPEGYAACGTACVNILTDSTHCGACERACQSSEECSGGNCEPICPAGQHACNGACVSDFALETCGKSCSPCPQTANGRATCDGKSCGVVCDPNTRPCSGACATCPTTSGSVMCSGTGCVSSGCPRGEHRCDGACVEETDGSCGEACLTCPSPPTNGFQVCLNGGCEFLCRPGYRYCGTGCCPADRVEVGAFHSCSITPGGAVLCWGRNHLTSGSGGALGTGDLVDHTTAVAVSGMASGMAAVQPGAFHTCAMSLLGGVQCWGWNRNGRLGDGATVDSLIPRPVGGMKEGAVAISAGESGGCVLSRVGELSCWGENLHGEVGDGTVSPRNVPTLVSDLGSSVVDVSFGGAHVCALMRGGTVRCWGKNAEGQLGDGTQVDRLRPVLVQGLLEVVRISAGDSHTCALRRDGQLLCWGGNSGGQVGQPISKPVCATPTLVAGVQGATELSAGGAHTCALFGAGQVQCWGSNESGQLGDGSTVPRPSPAPVLSLTDATSISAGKAHACAQARSGMRCWGNNEYGQIGDGSTTNRLTPVSTR